MEEVEEVEKRRKRWKRMKRRKRNKWEQKKNDNPEKDLNTIIDNLITKP